MPAYAQAKFRYRFIPMGITVSENHENPNYRVMDNRIFLDIGGGLGYGVLDNHFSEVDCSTASLVGKYKDIILEHINLDENNDTVEIVVHRSPDIDCFASAFLCQELIRTGKMPDNSPVLEQYIDEIDSGLFTIGEDILDTPLVIVYFMDYQNKPEEEIMTEGIDLISYSMQRLSKFSNKTLKQPGIIEHNHKLYKPMLDEARKDRKKYLSERDDPNICHKTMVWLPVKHDDTGKLCQVSALIWKKKPECEMHKHWARSDKEAPGQGYVFTFIPAALDLILKTEKEILEYESQIAELEKWFALAETDVRRNQIKRDIGWNDNQLTSKRRQMEAHKLADSLKVNFDHRAIISVKPDSEVWLKGLGAILEKKEKEKQRLAFQTDFHRWRSQDPSRIRRDYDIEDPWYDGRAPIHDYTIVDSPNRGSLLELSEICRIACNYTHPHLTDTRTRMIVPFQIEKAFGAKNLLDPIGTYLEGRGFRSDRRQPLFWPKEGSESIKIDKYLLPYIRNYFVDFDTECEQGREQLQTSVMNSMDYCVWYKGKSLQNRDEKKEKDVDIALFRWGVGFLMIDFNWEDFTDWKSKLKKEQEEFGESSEEAQYLKEYLAFNQLLQQQAEDFFAGVFGLPDQNKGKYIRGKTNIANLVEQDQVNYLYSRVTIDRNSYFAYNRPIILHGLCNVRKWEESQDETIIMAGIRDNHQLDINHDTIYGLGKAGAGLVIVDYEKSDAPSDQLNQHIIEKYESIHFILYLLALQQRKVLMRISQEMATFGKKAGKDINRLRERYQEFITRGWFSQVSEREKEMEIFNRWKRVFQVETLNQEVNEQLGALDEMHKSKISHQLNKFSWLFFPITILAGIFGALTAAAQIFGSFYGSQTYAVYNRTPMYGEIIARSYPYLKQFYSVVGAIIIIIVGWGLYKYFKE